MSNNPAIDEHNAAMEASRARFVTAVNNPRVPTPHDIGTVEMLTSQVVGLGATIEQWVPNGRNKSLALTALEDVLTRANRGIYLDGGANPGPTYNGDPNYAAQEAGA